MYAIAGAFAFLLSATGAYLWHRSGQRPQEPRADVRETRAEPQLFRRDEPLNVLLFVPLDGVLVPETAQVTRQQDAQAQARNLLEALLADPRASQSMVLGALGFRGIFLDGSGTAYLDLKVKRDLKVSAAEELLSLYSLVNTLVQNSGGEVRQVSFLIDGREALTLAGHVDLMRMFSRRTDLVRH